MNIVVLHMFLSCFVVGFVSSTRYSCDQTAPCGCSKADADVNKIVGGESAVPSSWSWAVSLQVINGGHFCGGSLVSPSFVITAAHCIPNAAEFLTRARVVIGIDNLSESSSNKATVRSVAGISMHPRYNKDTNENDIAILRLSQPVSLTLDRNPARLCLPNVEPANMALGYPASSLNLVAVGWGKLTESAITIPANLQLQQVTLESMAASHQMCVRTIKEPRTQFCASRVGGGKDTCQGDSGGPLMHFNPNTRRWVLAGITSFGIGCGNPSYAGVYTRVSAYRDWMKSVINDGGLYETAVNQTDFRSSSPSHHFSFHFCLLIFVFAHLIFKT